MNDAYNISVMRRDLRPQSAKAKLALNKPTPLSDDPSFLTTPTKDYKIDSHNPNKAHSHHEHPELIEPSKEDKRMSSSSKLLKKYENIKAYRSSKHSLLEKPDFDSLPVKESLKYQATQACKRPGPKTQRKISEDVPADKIQYPELRPTSALTNNILKKNRLEKSARPGSGQEEVVELPVISESELILEKEGVGEGESRRAYWRSENKFVSLFLLEKNENLNYSHQHILPIYAEVRMGGHHYVVSDEYRNCSLSHLIQEFGPFPEPLAKRYLKQIGLGLQHLHYHKKSHNQLNPRTILYNKQGNLFINMIKAAAGYRRKDQFSAPDSLHWHSPESLSPHKSRSTKNDIWALGCLAIHMLTPHPLPRSPLHPYNLPQSSPREETMLDNLRQRYPSQLQVVAKEDAYPLSAGAISFIRSCLQILEERRPEMEWLLEHEFFERA